MSLTTRPPSSSSQGPQFIESAAATTYRSWKSLAFDLFNLIQKAIEGHQSSACAWSGALDDQTAGEEEGRKGAPCSPACCLLLIVPGLQSPATFRHRYCLHCDDLVYLFVGGAAVVRLLNGESHGTAH